MLEKKEANKGRRNGDINGINRLKSGVKSFKNGKYNTRTITLVWSQDEQIKNFGWQITKRFLSSFLPTTLTPHQILFNLLLFD